MCFILSMLIFSCLFSNLIESCGSKCGSSVMALDLHSCFFFGHVKLEVFFCTFEVYTTCCFHKK